MNEKTRVLVVDDSALMREILVKVLSTEADFEIVGTARDGIAALSAIERLKPHVVTLDVEMPGLSGLDVMERHKGTNVFFLVVASVGGRASNIAERALAIGAFDVVPKPDDVHTIAKLSPLLISKIRAADAKRRRILGRKASASSANPPAPAAFGGVSTVKSSNSTPASSGRATSSGSPAPGTSPGASSTPARIGHLSSAAPARLIRPLSSAAPPRITPTSAPLARDLRPQAPVPVPPSRKMTHRLIAIGASTGGPDAVARVLKAFPAGMPPIVIVQHMPEGFTGKFAARLNSFCSIRVEEAHDGATLEPGLALIAPGTKCHMIVERNNADLVVRLIDAPPVMHHRPSVDVLFNSCAAVVGKRTVAALLTGMGTDGARGLLALRQAGAVTIAQDGESSVVYGMPMEAAAIGAAMHVLPILKIGESMVHATYGGDIQDVA